MRERAFTCFNAHYELQSSLSRPQEGSWEMVKPLLLCVSICRRLVLFFLEVGKVWVGHCKHVSHAYQHMARYMSTDIYLEQYMAFGSYVRTHVSELRPSGVICEGKGQMESWRDDVPDLGGVRHWQS